MLPDPSALCPSEEGEIERDALAETGMVQSALKGERCGEEEVEVGV